MPAIPYRDPLAMVDWLSATYGFQKQRILRNEIGEIAYAQLGFGRSAIMVVPAADATHERLVVHPDQIGGVETQTCYLVVSDIDAHYARTTAKGAEIIRGIRPSDRGGKSYTSRDPEGHIWTFGTYDPSDNRHRNTAVARGGRGLRLSAPLLVLTLLVLTGSTAVAVWVFAGMLSALEADVTRFATEQHSARKGAERDARNLANELLQVRTAKESADRDVTSLMAELSQARAALAIAARAEKEARDALAHEIRARDGLVRAAGQAADQLALERTGREAAEKTAREAADHLSRLQFARATAERTAKETSDRCELERKSRTVAERAVYDATAELARERSARAAAEIAASELRNQLAAIGASPQSILALRDQVDAERRARESSERANRDAQLLLVQEKYSRDATERALKHAQERLAAASCWACPTGAPCARPE